MIDRADLIDDVIEAMDNVSDMDVTMRQYATAVVDDVILPGWEPKDEGTTCLHCRLHEAVLRYGDRDHDGKVDPRHTLVALAEVVVDIVGGSTRTSAHSVEAIEFFFAAMQSHIEVKTAGEMH